MAQFKRDVTVKEKTKKVPPVKFPRNLEIRRELILQSITFDYTRIVFVWSCSVHFSIEFAVHALTTYGAVTNILYRWPAFENNGSNIKRGALVEFAKKTDAEKATKEFPYRNTPTRIAMLSSLIHHIANFEVMYPSGMETTTKISIMKRGFLQVDEVKKLHQKLHTYGAITFLIFDNFPSITTSICEVSYLSVTHAFLATIMTNGAVVAESVFACELLKNVKEEKILQAAKNYETLFLGNNFPC